MSHPWIIIDRLADVILENVKGCIVEIGSGSSTLILAKHAEAVGVKFYSCDSSYKICNWIEENVKYDKFVLFRGTSFKFMETFNDSPSIVFIDGNHNADVVREETNFFLTKMLVGG